MPIPSPQRPRDDAEHAEHAQGSLSMTTQSHQPHIPPARASTVGLSVLDGYHPLFERNNTNDT